MYWVIKTKNYDRWRYIMDTAFLGKQYDHWVTYKRKQALKFASKTKAFAYIKSHAKRSGWYEYKVFSVTKFMWLG